MCVIKANNLRKIDESREGENNNSMNFNERWLISECWKIQIEISHDTEKFKNNNNKYLVKNVTCSIDK